MLAQDQPKSHGMTAVFKEATLKKFQVAPYKNQGRFYVVPFKSLLRVQIKRASLWFVVKNNFSLELCMYVCVLCTSALDPYHRRSWNKYDIFRSYKTLYVPSTIKTQMNHALVLLWGRLGCQGSTENFFNFRASICVLRRKSWLLNHVIYLELRKKKVLAKLIKFTK